MGLFGPNKKELQGEIERLKSLLTPEQQELEKLNEQIAKFSSDSEKAKKEYENINARLEKAKKELEKTKEQIIDAKDRIEMYDYGIYSPSYEFANSDLYKAELVKIRDAQKQLIKENAACHSSSTWTVNNSKSEGRAMVRDTVKLLLRAFNLECDDIVSNVKISNFEKSIERIYKSCEQISKLGKIMNIYITDRYRDLKIEEVKLALDFQQKKQEEKEAIKELRRQQREEARVQKEIEAERQKLLKEQSHYNNALKALLLQIEKSGQTPELLEKKAQLEAQLADTAVAIENVDYREANKKAGYVYIISNIGAFGENVYKIGMTRRLDPQERIDELGDASVPFNYDVHAMIFTDDAPKLEAALHSAFEDKKLNKINPRREFFKVTLEDVKTVVRKNFDKTVEWIDVPEAEQYRQSVLLSQK